ncbi:Tfx family DNA-binding protein [uncultured Methanoregula sp.]|uniref:Tfx family DNA-binding protein n=1 Tax=uncultured Methanoregula sp. TaxID=1005933 RepID=UPI002AAA8C08|nr:Tfx family DNA-binding protein [uncultured Methanoregula sp.]
MIRRPPRCLLTDRQIEILRYRRQGMTFRQIAGIIHTTASNAGMVDVSARKKIQQAKEALEFFRTLESHPLCTLKAGTSLIDAVCLIFLKADKTGIPVPVSPASLFNWISAEHPDRIQDQVIQDDIEIYLRDNGELFSDRTYSRSG